MPTDVQVIPSQICELHEKGYHKLTHRRSESRALSTLRIRIDVLPTVIDWWTQMTWLYSLVLINCTQIIICYVLAPAFTAFRTTICKDSSSAWIYSSALFNNNESYISLGISIHTKSHYAKKEEKKAYQTTRIMQFMTIGTWSSELGAQ